MRTVATSSKPSWGQRFRTSQTILRQSARALGGVPHLWGLPILSGLLMLGMIGVFIGLGDSGAIDGALDGAGILDPALLGYVALFMVLMLPLTFFVSVLNAAFVHGVYEHLAGRTITRRTALGMAWGQGWTLLRFNLIATFVGGVLAIVGQVLGKLRIIPGLGRVFEIVGTFGWAAASFFVIPIIVVERERSATRALKESVGMARRQFGEMVSGIVTITLALMVPVLVIAFVTISLLLFGLLTSAPLWLGEDAFFATFMVVIGAFMMLMVAIGQLGQTFQLVYQTALYRHARTGHTAAPFTEETLVDAWAGYQRK